MGAGASIVTRERSIGELGAGGWERGTTCCVNTPDFVISHQEPWHKCHQALALASWSMVGTDGGYCTFETLTRLRIRRLKLKKVGKTARPFRYDLNQIPYDYTMK